MLIPFFHKIYATGNAPYSGPACSMASRIAIIIPLMPDSCPMYFWIFSFGIHISSSPTIIKIAGIKVIRSITESLKFTAISFPGCKLKIKEQAINIIKSNIQQ
jgi:hypothetical protein